MNTHPLVSVLTPVYNGRQTLGIALASLCAQTYSNWESIVVDDGSTDHPEEIIEQFNDRRIRYVRLPENKGRPHARNIATSMARGEYVAMLDADDWCYPDKLARQLEVFTADPSLAVVSTSMGIVDVHANLVGVRGAMEPASDGVFYGAFPRLKPPPLSFPASMFRTRDLEHIRFDPKFPVAEDVDYLIKLMLGRRYAVVNDVEYVYREWDTTSLAKVWGGLRCLRGVFLTYRDRLWMASYLQAALTTLKMPVYWTANTIGFWDKIIARRCQPPSAEHLQAYERARTVVSEAMTNSRRGNLEAQDAVAHSGNSIRS